MKITIAYLSLLLFVISCSSGTDKKVGASGGAADSAAGGSAADRSAAARPAFMSLDTVLPFPGLWVNTAYVESIRKTLSPRASQNAGDGKSFITMPERTLQTTSWIYGFHEGGEGVIVVKDGPRYKLYRSDTSKFISEITPLPGGRLRIGDQTFVQLQHPDSTVYDKGIIEELLFAGKYLDEQGRTVTFETNGRVTGLDTFTHYQPQCDYVENREDFEELFLGRQLEIMHMTRFGYEIKKDSLIIYQLQCMDFDSVGKYCDSAVFVRRLRTLVRQN